MKAIQFKSFGGPEVLEYLDLPPPQRDSLTQGETIGVIGVGGGVGGAVTQIAKARGCRVMSSSPLRKAPIFLRGFLRATTA